MIFVLHISFGDKEWTSRHIWWGVRIKCNGLEREWVFRRVGWDSVEAGGAGF